MKKIILIIMALLVVLAVAYYISVQKHLYLVGAGGAIKIRIPQEIVDNKDCDGYEEFAGKQVRPGFIPPLVCPWREVEPVGKFIIRDITFKIPREYLWLGYRKADGETESVHVMVKFPTMDAANDFGEQGMNIPVTINGRADKKEVCYKEHCVDLAQSSYISMSHLSQYLRGNKEEYKPKKQPRLPEMAIDRYWFRVSNDRDDDFFIKGSPLNPSYWLKCGVVQEKFNSRCESSLIYKNNMKVSYSFRRGTLMEQHAEIREQIINKLNQWSK